ncbi:hypothetical protein D3C71_1872370 [compost metagenome]
MRQIGAEVAEQQLVLFEFALYQYLRGGDAIQRHGTGAELELMVLTQGMTGFRLPWRNTGIDPLRIELPGFIVGLQCHIAQLQHIGLNRQYSILLR